MKKFISIILAAALLLSLSACVKLDMGGNAENTTAQPVLSPLPVDGSFVFTPENMPQIGCTRAYEKLAYAFAGAALGASGEQVSAYVKVYESITECYTAFVNGAVKLIIASSPDREISEAAYNSEFLWKYTALGRDALVFICYRGNALNNISVLNLRYLYQGCYKNWSELGGYDTPMLIYGAQSGSTTALLFNALFGVAEKDVQTQQTEQYDSQLGYVSARAPYTEQKGSIGCSTYNYCASGAGNVLGYSKMLALDGVVPDRQTINSAAYTFVYDFGVLLAESSAADSPEGILYEWICSGQGHALTAAAGY